MILRFMLNKSQRGLDKMMLRTPVTPPMVTDWRHLIVSLSIFSASSILYFRATRKRRIVAFRLPHGQSSSGISTHLTRNEKKARSPTPSSCLGVDTREKLSCEKIHVTNQPSYKAEKGGWKTETGEFNI